MSDEEAQNFRRFMIEMAQFEGESSSHEMRLIREFCGLTLHGAAERFGVSAGRLLDWEDGVVRPAWATVFKFAEAVEYIAPKPNSDIKQ